MDKPIIYVGLDVHKDTIAVALAEAGKRGDVRQYGRSACPPLGKAGGTSIETTVDHALIRGLVTA